MSIELFDNRDDHPFVNGIAFRNSDFRGRAIDVDLATRKRK